MFDISHTVQNSVRSFGEWGGISTKALRAKELVACVFSTNENDLDADLWITLNTIETMTQKTVNSPPGKSGRLTPSLLCHPHQLQLGSPHILLVFLISQDWKQSATSKNIIGKPWKNFVPNGFSSAWLSPVKAFRESVSWVMDRHV